MQVFIRAVVATGSVAARQFARWLVSEQWTWLTERYLAAARDLPSRVLKALAGLDKPLLGVAACGTHAELLQTSAIYREIYESQLGAGVPA